MIDMVPALRTKRHTTPTIGDAPQRRLPRFGEQRHVPFCPSTALHHRHAPRRGRRRAVFMRLRREGCFGDVGRFAARQCSPLFGFLQFGAQVFMQRLAQCVCLCLQFLPGLFDLSRCFLLQLSSGFRNGFLSPFFCGRGRGFPLHHDLRFCGVSSPQCSVFGGSGFAGHPLGFVSVLNVCRRGRGWRELLLCIAVNGRCAENAQLAPVRPFSAPAAVRRCQKRQPRAPVAGLPPPWPALHVVKGE